MNIVISQPMFFPWIGMLEQIRLANTYVDYNDVQFSKGSFVNRVQIKTENGSHWLTVPLSNPKLGQKISDVEINEKKDWRRSHLELLSQSYRKARYCSDMLDLVGKIYEKRHTKLGSLAHDSFMSLCQYFDLTANRKFLDISELPQMPLVNGSQRVLSIVRYLGGTVYVTGHGAQNYLEHEAFEKAGIRVEYLNYKKLPYPQLHGEFTPYVSALDLIANVGPSGIEYICSRTVPWREFVK